MILLSLKKKVIAFASCVCDIAIFLLRVNCSVQHSFSVQHSSDSHLLQYLWWVHSKSLVFIELYYIVYFFCLLFFTIIKCLLHSCPLWQDCWTHFLTICLRKGGGGAALITLIFSSVFNPFVPLPQNPKEADAMTKIQTELDETKIILVSSDAKRSHSTDITRWCSKVSSATTLILDIYLTNWDDRFASLH